MCDLNLLVGLQTLEKQMRPQLRAGMGKADNKRFPRVVKKRWGRSLNFHVATGKKPLDSRIKSIY